MEFFLDVRVRAGGVAADFLVVAADGSTGGRLIAAGAGCAGSVQKVRALPLTQRSIAVGSESVADFEDMHVHAKAGRTVDAGVGEVLEPVPGMKGGK